MLALQNLQTIYGVNDRSRDQAEVQQGSQKDGLLLFFSAITFTHIQTAIKSVDT